MAIAVESHIITPVAISNRAPEPYIDILAPRSIVPRPGENTGAQKGSVQVDSIRLSLSAQIHLLKSRGNSDKQIAIALNVDTTTVADYLGNTTAAAVRNPVAPAK